MFGILAEMIQSAADVMNSAADYHIKKDRLEYCKKRNVPLDQMFTKPEMDAMKRGAQSSQDAEIFKKYLGI